MNALTEKTAAGEKTRYAAEPSETFEGTLTATQGVGGENTGMSIKIGDKFIELVLSDSQRTQFVGVRRHGRRCAK